MKEYLQTKFFKIPIGKRFRLLSTGAGPYTRVGRNSAQGTTPAIILLPLTTRVVRERDIFFHWPPPTPVYGEIVLDPALPPPFPTSHYGATIHIVNNVRSQPLVTWTNPDLIISIAVSVVPGPVEFLVTVTNYAYPQWLVSENYQAGFRVKDLGVAYYSLADDNSGFTPGDGDPWAVDDTIFKLYVISAPDGNDQRYTDWTQILSGETAPTLVLPWAFPVDDPPNAGARFFLYVTATKGGITTYSATTLFVYHP